MLYRPMPPIWPPQTLLVGGHWSPGILPPTVENWPDAIDTAPEKRRSGSLNVTTGRDRVIESQTEQKGKGLKRVYLGE